MRVALLLPALLAAAVPLSADDGRVPLVLSLEDQANALWSALPDEANDPRVTLGGDTSRECAQAALRSARRLLEPGGGRAALRGITLPVQVSQDSADQLLGGHGSAALLASQLGPGTRSEMAVQPLQGDSCDDAGAFYDLRLRPGPSGRFVLQMVVEGGCACGGGVSSQPRFHVVGQAELEPGVAASREALRLRTGAPHYEVFASCTPCGSSPVHRALQAAGGGPCDRLCAPLANGLAGWQEKLTAAAERAADLAGKATTLQLQMTSERQELAGAQSRPSKPRAVLERISALQAKIKSEQAELDRLTTASRDAQAAVTLLQRLTGETSSAAQECRSQCVAREERKQQQAQQAPVPPVAAKGGGGGKGGGGKGLLIAGVLAAGGGAALALRGGDTVVDGPGAGGGGSGSGSGGTDFSGGWAGTRSTITRSGNTVCSRVYNETWTITQSGRDLRASISGQTSCAPSPTCPCDIPPIVQHVGTVEGNVARFFVFPQQQTPSCVLPLTLQGDAMAGSMPSCSINDGTQTHEVALRRR